MRCKGVSAVAAGCVAVLMLASGCSSGNTSTGSAGASGDDGFLDWDGANAEYQRTVADFPYKLENGDSFPKNMTKDGSTDENGDPVAYQKGSGASNAYFFWMCSVEKSILDHAGNDQQQTQESIDNLRQVLDSDWFATTFDDPGNHYKQIIDEAELGDTSGIQQNYSASGCTSTLNRQYEDQ